LTALARILPRGVLTTVLLVLMMLGLVRVVTSFVIVLALVTSFVIVLALVVTFIVALVTAFIVILALVCVVGRSSRSGVGISICNDGRDKEQSDKRKYSLGMHGVKVQKKLANAKMQRQRTKR